MYFQKTKTINYAVHIILIAILISISTSVFRLNFSSNKKESSNYCDLTVFENVHNTNNGVCSCCCSLTDTMSLKGCCCATQTYGVDADIPASNKTTNRTVAFLICGNDCANIPKIVQNVSLSKYEGLNADIFKSYLKKICFLTDNKEKFIEQFHPSLIDRPPNTAHLYRFFTINTFFIS